MNWEVLKTQMFYTGHSDYRNSSKFAGHVDDMTFADCHHGNASGVFFHMDFGIGGLSMDPVCSNSRGKPKNTFNHPVSISWRAESRCENLLGRKIYDPAIRSILVICAHGDHVFEWLSPNAAVLFVRRRRFVTLC